MSEEDLEVALCWGTEIPQPLGRTAYTIDKRAVRRASADGVDLESYLGLVAVQAEDGVIVTAIRTSDVRRLRTFGKYRIKGARK